ncbi:MAG: threonylcarbamoyl-AMP synthase [Bacilli bacterium]|nr:threonylcarbamoyl-AMP synthase [Bacilli bacterium]MBO4682705.1 threonylcarbamoyl-AMP synthase [Bacilli bacterium]
MNKFKKAVVALNSHGVIAFPTETVMGLGVYFDDQIAYEKLNALKERKPNKPYTLMLYDPYVISFYAEVDQRAVKLINKFMPGPITLLLKVKGKVPRWVTHGTGVIGIRVPNNKKALDLLYNLDKPLLVPSANKADQPPCMNSKEVEAVFGDLIDYIIKGKANGGVSSTIVDLTGPEVKIVREGPLTKEDIFKALEE